MTMTNRTFEIGEEVTVSDKYGSYECRGKIVGRYACAVDLFDVQPNRSESLAKRLHAIPERQLRRVSREVRAYEPKKMEEPIIVMGDA